MNLGMVLTEKLEERERKKLNLHQNGDLDGEQM